MCWLGVDLFVCEYGKKNIDYLQDSGCGIGIASDGLDREAIGRTNKVPCQIYF